MEAELHEHHGSLLCCRYEDEINRRTAAENEFVVLKKVRGAYKEGRGHCRNRGPGTTCLSPKQPIGTWVRVWLGL